MTNLIYNEFPNVGFISTQLPKDILQHVKAEIEAIRQNESGFKSANDILAGNMEKQFHLKNSRKHIEPFLEYLSWTYTNKWGFEKKVVQSINGESDQIDIEFKLDKLWANFQKKYEFNPTHSHMGVFSFACWIEIPYNIEDELNLNQVKYSNAKATSCFTFSYTNILGDILNFPIPVDKGMEGHMIFFPAELSHAVYPFYTSNDYRISIAGNISVNKI